LLPLQLNECVMTQPHDWQWSKPFSKALCLLRTIVPPDWPLRFRLFCTPLLEVGTNASPELGRNVDAQGNS
jgi:hypothetical protein